MRAADVPAVMRLADVVHPTFFEGASVFHDRLALFPEGQWVLPGPGLELAGYAVSYPARLGAPPTLDTVLGALPEDADSLYIHDVALHPAFRGRRLAEPVIARLLRLAGGRPAMLVSVYGTAPFWARFGFCERQGERIAAKLASFGAGAVFMTREPGEEKAARD